MARWNGAGTLLAEDVQERELGTSMALSRTLTRRFSATRDDEKVRVEARFRFPKRIAAGGYRCRCELRADQLIERFAFEGEDEIQALLFAFMFIAIELQSVARAYGLKIPRWELADWLRLCPRSLRRVPQVALSKKRASRTRAPYRLGAR